MLTRRPNFLASISHTNRGARGGFAITYVTFKPRKRANNNIYAHAINENVISFQGHFLLQNVLP